MPVGCHRQLMNQKQAICVCAYKLIDENELSVDDLGDLLRVF